MTDTSVVGAADVVPISALCPQGQGPDLFKNLEYRWVKIGAARLQVTPFPGLLTPTILYNDGTSEPTSVEYFQKCLLTCSDISSGG